MIMKVNSWKSINIKRPTYARKPIYKKRNKVYYSHPEYGIVKGFVNDVFIFNPQAYPEKIKGLAYYDADFPDIGLTVTNIPETELSRSRNFQITLVYFPNFLFNNE